MPKTIRVLLTGYEAAPFYKRGGLGDVLGSLPKALIQIGIDARVVIPCYEEIRKNLSAKRIGKFKIHFGEKEEEIGIYRNAGTPRVYFLSNSSNLSYLNTRGRNKKIEQFAFFDLAVVHFVTWLSKQRQWNPSVIHCNDWHTGLIPLILRNKTKLPIPTLLTIHNLSYQGFGSLKVLDLLHIKDEDAKEIKRGMKVTEINILGEGILHASSVSTVSKTYAREITDEKNEGPIYAYVKKREETLGRSRAIVGILNGIDYDVWSPQNDSAIFHTYNVANWQSGKEKNKKKMLNSLDLEPRLTFCFIGRMASQKGLDILVRVTKHIVNNNANLIILGSGAPNIEKSIRKLVARYSSHMRVEFAYNEDFAHKLYASSDFIIIPSRFEPCGLIQMIAMSYGTIPIASRTGGLKDSIKNNRNGFLFENGSVLSLKKAIKRAVKRFHDEARYGKMVVNAMNTDFSWKRSARLYKKLYQNMLLQHNVTH